MTKHIARQHPTALDGSALVAIDANSPRIKSTAPKKPRKPYTKRNKLSNIPKEEEMDEEVEGYSPLDSNASMQVWATLNYQSTSAAESPSIPLVHHYQGNGLVATSSAGGGLSSIGMSAGRSQSVSYPPPHHLYSYDQATHHSSVDYGGSYDMPTHHHYHMHQHQQAQLQYEHEQRLLAEEHHRAMNESRATTPVEYTQVDQRDRGIHGHYYNEQQVSRDVEASRVEYYRQHQEQQRLNESRAYEPQVTPHQYYSQLQHQHQQEGYQTEQEETIQEHSHSNESSENSQYSSVQDQTIYSETPIHSSQSQNQSNWNLRPPPPPSSHLYYQQTRQAQPNYSSSSHIYSTPTPIQIQAPSPYSMASHHSHLVSNQLSPEISPRSYHPRQQERQHSIMHQQAHDGNQHHQFQHLLTSSPIQRYAQNGGGYGEMETSYPSSSLHHSNAEEEQIREVLPNGLVGSNTEESQSRNNFEERRVSFMNLGRDDKVQDESGAFAKAIEKKLLKEVRFGLRSPVTSEKEGNGGSKVEIVGV